jgi:hypothetical protein
LLVGVGAKSLGVDAHDASLFKSGAFLQHDIGMVSGIQQHAMKIDSSDASLTVD